MGSWQAPYDTGWISRSDWTNVHLGSDTTKNADSNITHNLNAPLSKLLVKGFVSTDGTDANSFEAPIGTCGLNYNTNIFEVDLNNIKVQTGTDGITFLADDGTWTGNILNSDDWYYKVKVWYLG